jgi:hypothetical protein
MDWRLYMAWDPPLSLPHSELKDWMLRSKDVSLRTLSWSLLSVLAIVVSANLTSRCDVTRTLDPTSAFAPFMAAARDRFHNIGIQALKTLTSSIGTLLGNRRDRLVTMYSIEKLFLRGLLSIDTFKKSPKMGENCTLINHSALFLSLSLSKN